MIRLAGVIAFADGRQQAVEVRQAEYAAWELYALRHHMSSRPDEAPPMMMTRYLAFAAIQRGELRPQKDWDDFDEWSLLVDDVELDAESLEEAESKLVPPTLPDRSAG